jgi:hypothetical protein
LTALEDEADEGVALDVVVRELDEGGIFEAGSDVFRELDATEGAVVSLLGVAGEGNFGATPEASEDTQEHFGVHLLDFVNEDEGPDEGPAAAPTNRDEFEFSFSEELHEEGAAYELSKVIEDGAGVGEEFFEQVTGEGAEVFAKGGGDAADDQDFINALFVKQFEGDG